MGQTNEWGNKHDSHFRTLKAEDTQKTKKKTSEQSQRENLASTFGANTWTFIIDLTQYQRSEALPFLLDFPVPISEQAGGTEKKKANTKVKDVMNSPIYHISVLLSLLQKILPWGPSVTAKATFTVPKRDPPETLPTPLPAFAV